MGGQGSEEKQEEALENLVNKKNEVKGLGSTLNSKKNLQGAFKMNHTGWVLIVARIDPKNMDNFSHFEA